MTELQAVDRTSRAYLLEAAAFDVGPPLRQIRLKCHECQGGEPGGPVTARTARWIEECSSVACALWPYRLGFDPRREPMPEERRAAVRERFLAHRQPSETVNGHNNGSLEECVGAGEPYDGPLEGWR
jgi:hypothetical protein